MSKRNYNVNHNQEETKKIIRMEAMKELGPEEKIDTFIREKLKEDANNIEKKLNANRNLDNIEVPNDMFDNIVKELKEKGVWVENEVTKEESAKKAYDLLSEEDRKALEIGKKQLARRWYQKLGKAVGTAALVVLGVFTLSMTSGANRKYVMGVWNTFLGGELQVKVSNVEEIEIQEGKEEEIYVKITDTLGIKPLKLLYRPQGLELYDYNIDVKFKDCIMQYKYEGELLSVYMYVGSKDAKSVQKFDGKIIDNISTKFLGQEIDIYEMKNPENKNTYSTGLEYDENYYVISGTMDKENFVKIAENIIF